MENGVSSSNGEEKMSEKTLVLARKTNVLRIYNEDDNLRGISYTAIYNVTGLKTNGKGWYDFYNKTAAVGFVSGVKEVKEKWY
jgi:hypothetical protein